MHTDAATGSTAAMGAASEPPASASALTRKLLACGAAAGPLYLVVGAVQVLTREGFDMRRHPLSLLSNGDLGWIQIANFIVAGALVLAGAVGVRRRLHPGRAATWGPILLAVWGIGLIGSGLFVADPGQGFPPGVVVEEGAMSRSGMLHFVFGGLAFYALVGACMVFARRFWGLGQRGWALYSLLSGVGFLIVFGGIASGSTASVFMLSFYAAVAWIWVWHAAVSVRLMPAALQAGRTTPVHDVGADRGEMVR
jgi:hypothetical protein